MNSKFRKHSTSISCVFLLLLLGSGCQADSVDRFDENGKTELYKTVVKCPRQFHSKDSRDKKLCLEKVEELLKKGASPNLSISSNPTDSPIGLMIKWQFIPEVFDLLHEYGGDIRSPIYASRSPMYLLISKAGVEGVASLLEKGVHVDEIVCCQEKGGQTPLVSAVLRFESISDAQLIIEKLVKSGADLNHVYDEFTTLEYVVRTGNPQLVKLLIKEGVDINSGSPVAMAVVVSNPEILDLLVSAGADINKKSKYGKTPVSISKSRDDKALVEKLIQLGARS